MKRLRRGNARELHAGASEGRVGLPETGVAAKVRQAGIDADAGAGRDDQRIGLGDQVGGALELLLLLGGFGHGWLSMLVGRNVTAKRAAGLASRRVVAIGNFERIDILCVGALQAWQKPKRLCYNSRLVGA
ncbi:hypothetical protein [Janthinobacterium sp. CG_23.3]|uniref:hypothetical protein n=1 Tax=Janthinobacterium sp. CG_23.3 TaxID=3349634 RepID=UPI0038D39CC7